MLLADFLLDCQPSGKELIFPFPRAKKNDVVRTVNLYFLLQLSKRALAEVKQTNHEALFNSSKAMDDLLKKGQSELGQPISTECPSGLATLKKADGSI